MSKSTRRTSPVPGPVAKRARRRGARRLAAVAAGLTVLVCAACTLSAGAGAGAGAGAAPSAGSNSETGAAPSTDGSAEVRGPEGTAVRYPEGAFPNGVSPDLQLRGEDADDFQRTFGIAAAAGGTPDVAQEGAGEDAAASEGGAGAGGEVTVLQVTADEQPATEVEIVIPYEPSEVPDGAQPAIFYYDDELGLWLPILTVADPGTGTLVGTTDHFTDFFAGALSTVQAGAQAGVNWVGDGLDWVGGGADWAQYQLADLTGARAKPPTCRGEHPAWVADVDIYEDPVWDQNIPMYVCAGAPSQGATADGSLDDDLEIRLAVNRGYSLEVTSTVAPAGFSLVPKADLGSASSNALSTTVSDGDTTSVLVPATAEGVFRFAAPDDLTPIEMRGGVSMRSAIMDAVIITVGFALSRSELKEVDAVETYDCVIKTLDNAVGSAVSFDQDRFVGAYAGVSADCLGPVMRAINEGGLTARAERLLKGLEVGLLMGRAGQSAIDGIRAVGAEGEYTVTVTPRDVPDVTAIGAKLGDVSGVWRGRADGDQDYYDVEVSLTRDPDANGGWAATIRYPNYRETGDDLCGGTLEPNGVEGDGDVLLFIERIEWEEANACTRDGDARIARIDDSTLLFEWRKGGTYLFSILSADGATAATPLFQLPNDSRSRSGDAAEAPVGGVVPLAATAQWVGCGSVAWTEFELGGAYSSTSGAFVLQDGTPPGLQVDVQVAVGGPPPGAVEDAEPGEVGEVVASGRVTLGQSLPFEASVEGQDVLSVSATATNPDLCQASSLAYGVLLDAWVQP